VSANGVSKLNAVLGWAVRLAWPLTMQARCLSPNDVGNVIWRVILMIEK
jgi:hypothetical protein